MSKSTTRRKWLLRYWYLFERWLYTVKHLRYADARESQSVDSAARRAREQVRSAAGVDHFSAKSEARVAISLDGKYQAGTLEGIVTSNSSNGTLVLPSGGGLSDASRSRWPATGPLRVSC